MTDGIQDIWLAALKNWASGKPAIARAWVFGSRANGTYSSLSDLDIALLLDPDDGKVLAEWIFNAEAWRNEAQSLVGAYPEIDLQLAWPGEDQIVWPAVKRNGILFFDRGL